MHSHTTACTKLIIYSLAYLQDLIPILAGIKYITKTQGLNLVDMLENPLFVHAVALEMDR